MSEERRTLRKRRHLVNLQITFVSWCLELAMGLLILLRMFIFWATGMEMVYVQHYLRYLDCVLNFIAIPSIYVINNEVTKRIIVLENWFQGIRNVLGRYNRVEPPTNSVPMAARTIQQKDQSTVNKNSGKNSQPSQQPSQASGNSCYYIGAAGGQSQ